MNCFGFTRDKSFDDRHTQVLLKDSEELQLDMDDKMIDLILASGID